MFVYEWTAVGGVYVGLCIYAKSLFKVVAIDLKQNLHQNCSDQRMLLMIKSTILLHYDVKDVVNRMEIIFSQVLIVRITTHAAIFGFSIYTARMVSEVRHMLIEMKILKYFCQFRMPDSKQLYYLWSLRSTPFSL